MANYTSYHDNQLLHLLKSGDELAFTEIYNRYWQQIYAIGMHFSSSKQITEDCVQQVFMSLWNRREQLNIVNSFPGYLAVAIKYNVLNYRLQQKNRLHILDSVSTQNNTISVDEHLEARILSVYLNKVVDQLKEKTQLIYRYSREGNLSNKEIAKKMQISQKTVESHLTKALKTLKLSLHQIRF